MIRYNQAYFIFKRENESANRDECYGENERNAADSLFIIKLFNTNVT